MSAEKSPVEDLFSKALGVTVALGALGVGVAAALMNNERTRQMREELRGQISDLGKRVDELSSQGTRVLEERRPEIESTIARSRQAIVGGLEKAKSVVEQGADKAQEYVRQKPAAASTEQTEHVAPVDHNGQAEH